MYEVDYLTSRAETLRDSLRHKPSSVERVPTWLLVALSACSGIACGMIVTVLIVLNLDPGAGIGP